MLHHGTDSESHWQYGRRLTWLTTGKSGLKLTVFQPETCQCRGLVNPSGTVGATVSSSCKRRQAVHSTALRKRMHKGSQAQVHNLELVWTHFKTLKLNCRLGANYVTVF